MTTGTASRREKIFELINQGMSFMDASSLTDVLERTGVLGPGGIRRIPDPEDVLELLKWHANGKGVVAVGISKLAREFGCSSSSLGMRLNCLESWGLIRRYRNRTHGNMYVTEIVGKEPLPGALSPDAEPMLEELSAEADSDGLVQTSVYDLAEALGITYGEVLDKLRSLDSSGYVSSIRPDYGRPITVKVLYAGATDSVSNGGLQAFCMHCQEKRPILDASVRDVDTPTGTRRMASGLCSRCGSRASVLLSEAAPRGDSEPNGRNESAGTLQELTDHLREQGELLREIKDALKGDR